MSEPASDDLSSLTVAKLKVMCKENGLSMAGRKAELVERLDQHLNEESISLEEVETVPLPSKNEEEILVAEVIEADIIEETEAPVPVTSKSSETPLTFVDQIKNPKVAAVLLTILIATGGWYYYVNSQLQPFTADDLRYGDSMEYTLLNGDLEVTEGFIDLVQDNFDTGDGDYCRMQLEFSGKGTTSVTNGGTNELFFESDESLLGAVQAKGGYGLDWLTVEKTQTRNIDDLTFSRYRYKLPPFNTNECSSIPEATGGSLKIDTKSWTELSERDIISTQADWTIDFPAIDPPIYREGTTMSFGLGGVLGLLEEVAPGVAIVVSPVEIREMMGTKLIQTDANGTHLGWEWNVIGPDDVGDDEMWKIAMEHREIRENCFGHARITMWVTEDSPWAVRQNVDVHISEDGDKSSCGGFSDQLADIILPDGSLSLSLEMSKNSLTRGSKLLDLGRSYSSVPNAGAYAPSSSELSDWGNYDLHLPDNTTLRSHSLEKAVGCVTAGFVPEATAINSALDNDGYIWRARDNRSDSSTTRWNLSWVSTSPNSGWVVVDVLGEPSQANCNYVSHGGYDDSVAHSRNDIPSALNISMLEQDLVDSTRFPQLSGDDGFFTSSGEYHSQTRVGHLVVTPDGDYTDWINRLSSGDTGATTLDLTRSWSSSTTNNGITTQWDNTLSLAMDATTGQVIGWNHVKTPI
ncbi:MAG: hypothetical protein CMA19_00440 [Euryarchaeota archaeon]|nr:hypothetical protein [Euryarchaeota archaeon]